MVKDYTNNGLRFITVKNNDGFEVTFCSLGASIFSIKLDDKYLTQTPTKIDDFKLTSIYHGKTIGRVANRIERARIKIDGEIYKLDKNEPNRTLHGGREGLSTKIFDYWIQEKEDYVKVSYHYFSKDLEGGFPGNVVFDINYYVFLNKNEIELEYYATSDKDTLIALTNHTYFTLGTPDLSKLTLEIRADKFIHPNPKSLIPLEIRDVDKVMDFQKAKRITKDIDDKYLVDSLTNGYDHHYIFKEFTAAKPQVILKNKDYQLTIFTNFTGVQIYTDNSPDKYEWRDIKKDKRRSIAIEPQDSTLNREVLSKIDEYYRVIHYTFVRIKE